MSQINQRSFVENNGGHLDIKNRLEKGKITIRTAIIELVNSLPCLASMHITEETWHPEGLASLAGKVSSGERSAIQFVLHVWNPFQKWNIGPFDIGSLDSWDHAHREVFANWARNPWWC